MAGAAPYSNNNTNNNNNSSMATDQYHANYNSTLGGFTMIDETTTQSCSRGIEGIRNKQAPLINWTNQQIDCKYQTQSQPLILDDYNSLESRRLIAPQEQGGQLIEQAAQSESNNDNDDNNTNNNGNNNDDEGVQYKSPADDAATELVSSWPASVNSRRLDGEDLAQFPVLSSSSLSSSSEESNPSSSREQEDDGDDQEEDHESRGAIVEKQIDEEEEEDQDDQKDPLARLISSTIGDNMLDIAPKI